MPLARRSIQIQPGSSCTTLVHKDHYWEGTPPKSACPPAIAYISSSIVTTTATLWMPHNARSQLLELGDYEIVRMTPNPFTRFKSATVLVGLDSLVPPQAWSASSSTDKNTLTISPVLASPFLRLLLACWDCSPLSRNSYSAVHPRTWIQARIFFLRLAINLLLYRDKHNSSETTQFFRQRSVDTTEP